jgi:hypothetical protein
MRDKITAGPALKRGRPALTVTDAARCRLHRLYSLQGLSVRAVGQHLGIGEAAVRRRLKAAGIEARKGGGSWREPVLSLMDPAQLFSDIVLYGVESAARRRHVSKRLLQLHLARLRREASNK